MVRINVKTLESMRHTTRTMMAEIQASEISVQWSVGSTDQAVVSIHVEVLYGYWQVDRSYRWSHHRTLSCAL